ncbi:hypothetical protein [Amycolatopsis sp. cmx-4-83]|uniref:hypothetical protein n=1 Tax=Amycolatopsis sp. cmx-4-83 TaxID=2790940 RepID=UPI0039798C39
MFGERCAASMINRNAENDQDRRRFLKAAGSSAETKGRPGQRHGDEEAIRSGKHPACG